MSSGQRVSDSNWSADFETTTDRDDCRVWLWSAVNIASPEWCEYGTDINLFFSWCCEETRHIYFHNLAFDGSFILDAIMKRGFKHRIDASSIRPKQFATLISKMGKFYSITVRWENGVKTYFRDSLKKIPLPVRDVAKAFDLPMAKGEIDYRLDRPYGYVPTEAEYEYVRVDAEIVARALQTQFQAGMKKLTVGSDSLAMFKDMITPALFQRLFPVLPITMDSEIRKAYRGGFTYVLPKHRARMLGEGITLDVNSLYPYVMLSRPIPYGEPIYVAGKPTPTEDYPLFIAAITITAKLKKKHIACIQIKGSGMFSETQYLDVIDTPTTVYGTSIDWSLWFDHYDVKVHSYDGAWMFQQVEGLFTKYVQHWSKVKEESSGGMRTIAKLHLNSLYGKFATNPDVTPKIPVLEDGIVRLRLGQEETRNPVYTAAGLYITAHARDITIRAAQKHYQRFVYADTDSLHLLGHNLPSGLEIHPSKIGAWKVEALWSRALFARPKAYSEMLLDGTPSTHIAGLPQHVAHSLTPDDLEPGKTFTGKLLPERVPGGIVLSDVVYTLRY